jgi:hypothetical protein
MEVRAFDPAKNQELLKVLRTMDTVSWVGDGVESMHRWSPLDIRMHDLLETAKPIARDTTGNAGTFSLTVPSLDSVLVIAEYGDEEPNFTFKMVGARSKLVFDLDMSDGHCDPKIRNLRWIGGRIEDCSRDSVYTVPNVRLWAFDATANKELRSLLVKTDPSGVAPDDTAFAERRKAVYQQLLVFLGSAIPLAVDTSTPSGLYGLKFPATDTVLIVGLKDRSDGPYFGYGTGSGRSSVMVDLDMSGGRCRAEGWLATLQQTEVGRKFQDDFNRPDGPPGRGWNVRGSPAFWSIVGGVLRGKPTAATVQEIHVDSVLFDAPAPLSEMVVQARMRRVGTSRTTFPGILARHNGQGRGFRWVITNSASASQDEFRQVVSGQTSVLNTSASYDADNRWQQFKLSAGEEGQQGWKNGVKVFDLANRALAGVTGRPGLSTGWFKSTGDYHEFDDFVVYKKNTVSVTGLPPDHQVRLGARAAFAMSGTATVDLGADLCPLPLLEIWNGRGVLVARLRPVRGIWGGDAWSYSAKQ